ncbi:Dihydroorotase [Pirellula sp. SH-Sr6A]|uniref:dihydroorotase n=1 Tax=Pirellula sp. SH-Sr6A TaxID=1632865 RepID=UPI00078D821A|nr:dihydroorotase [Pirellula sp. SH-Sr6A]AMV31220.1 Dihydroorotase [Pirellula sp. SH-Sr6A]
MVRRQLIRSAKVVFPTGVAEANVLIENGTIASVDAPPTTSADQIIDAAGLVLFPGLIDDQVHFREPGLTHKEDLKTASQACVAGGVTSFLEMPNTKPAATTQERIEEKYAIASAKSIANYGFYIGATSENIEELKKATGVPGIKIFIGSSTGDLLVDDQDALERIFAETTLPICAHCEDESTVRANAERLKGTDRVRDHSLIRDHQAAIIATRRALDLAYRHRHRFHVLHVSTAAELECIRDHRQLITAELCPHHWEFCVEDYQQLGSLIQMNPSIKNREDTVALWQALRDGVLQVVATDHAPHTLEEKQKPYPASPSGLPAVENYFALLLDRASRGLCTWEEIARWTSDAPARVWGILGKGRIEVGYDADLVLVDPNLAKTIRNEEQFTKSKWSPWAGRTLRGWPVKTWVGGELAFDTGRVVRTEPAKRLAFDPSLGGYWNTPDGVGPNSHKQ